MSKTSEYALGRRALLIGLAAGAAAAAAPTTGAKAAEQEAPELLAMADALPQFEQDYVAARDEKQRIIDTYAASWPRAPKEIHYWGDLSTEERRIDGVAYRHIKGDGYFRDMTICVGTPEGYEAAIRDSRDRIAKMTAAGRKRGFKTERAWLARYEAALPLARAYWAEIESARKTTGVDAASARQTAAREALQARVDKIMTFPERTMHGVVIKAQAMNAWAKVDNFSRHLNLRAQVWADEMAAAIMRQAQHSA